MRAVRTPKGTLSVVALLVASQMLVGCAATRGRRFTEPEKSGFLGDYSELKKNPEFPAALVYIKPGVQWSRYDSIDIESAGLWVSDSTKNISREDQQHLTDVLYSKMAKDLGDVFKLSNQPGPNTLVLRVALTQAQGAKVPLRVVSTVVPQLRLPTAVLGLGTDTAFTVGSATVEMEVLDSVTNQRLAAGVDNRAGTKVLFAKRTFQTWGDVEAACDRWASRIAYQLARVGVQRKPGVAMPEEPSESRSF
jgi:Protein of unknown function (DUF3313)